MEQRVATSSRTAFRSRSLSGAASARRMSWRSRPFRARRMPCGRHGCGADPEAAGYERRPGVAGDLVAVERDPRHVQRLLGHLARQVRVETAQVDQHEVIVCAARNDAETFSRQRRRQSSGVVHDLGRVLGEVGLRSLVEGDRLGRDDVLERAALQAGEHGFVDRLAKARVERMQPPRGPRRVLWVVKVTMSENGTGLGWTRRR